MNKCGFSILKIVKLSSTHPVVEAYFSITVESMEIINKTISNSSICFLRMY